MTSAGQPPDRLDNGLVAASFIPLADVDSAVGADLLSALGRAGIAAYLEPQDGTDRHRLFVADGERADARSVVESAARAAGADIARPASQPAEDAVDTDTAFAALVSDWHVDTVAAVRNAERDLTREDADWRARLGPGSPLSDLSDPSDPNAAVGSVDGDGDEHYVPPAPPPLPRLAGATIRALLIIVASVGLLTFGGRLALDPSFTFLLGVAGVLLGAGLLIMRLRESPQPDDDDGAVV